MQLILTHFFNYPFFLFWASVSYPVQKVDASHCSDLGRVIEKADVSLGGGVQLSDLNVAESIQELAPHVASDSVPDGDSNFVVLLIFFLQKKTKQKTHSETADVQKTMWKENRTWISHLWHVAEVTQRLADVLHHRHVVLPAVVPELRGWKLLPQNKSETWK